MMNKNVQLVYDILLCIPGMDESVRLDAKIPRKLVLLLSQVVERGLAVKDGEGMIEAMPQEAIVQLQELIDGLMEKSGMILAAQKLKSMQQLK